LLVAHDDSVPGVVATVELHDPVGALTEEVCRLALSFVAPLHTDDDDSWHGSLPRLVDGYTPSYRRGVALPPKTRAAGRPRAGSIDWRACPKSSSPCPLASASASLSPEVLTPRWRWPGCARRAPFPTRTRATSASTTRMTSPRSPAAP